MPIPANIPPIIREAIAAHEHFRILGYPPEDIYFAPRARDLHVAVKHNGEYFHLRIGEHNTSIVELCEQWKQAAAWWNANANGPDKEACKELFETSLVRREAVNIITALALKGFPTHRSDA